MLKTCFICGKKEEKLFDNMCENCFFEKNPPIEDIKIPNLAFCNMCRKIHFQNQLYDINSISKPFEKFIRQKIRINENYDLKNIKVYNLEFSSGKLSFDLDVETKLK